jgi:hypothetical protein
MGKRCFGLTHLYRRFYLCFSLSLSLSSVPGQRCGPWAQSAGILRDSDTLSNTVLTLMAEIEFDKIFHVV